MDDNVFISLHFDKILLNNTFASLLGRASKEDKPVGDVVRSLRIIGNTMQYNVIGSRDVIGSMSSR